MASLSQVSIELQVKGEREATQALKRYSDASDKLNRSVLNAASKIESTTNAWDRANKLYEKGVLNAKALQAAQTQLARELAVLNGYTKTNGALNTQRALAELKAAEATRQAAAAEAQANAERKRAQQSYNQLRASIDQSYAARMRLKQAADTLRAAERQGIITREQAIEQLRQYRAAAQAAAQGGGFMGRNISKAGVLTQQAGYQVGDFIVQIQSGTNAFVAFGQQATQVAGTLTLLGGKWVGIGTALGIAIPLLTAIGAAFMRTREAADKTADSISHLDNSLKSLDSSLRDWLQSKKAAAMGITVEELLGIEGIEQAEQNLARAQERLKELTGTFGGGVVLGFDIFGLISESRRSDIEQAEADVAEAEERLKQIRIRKNEESLAAIRLRMGEFLAERREQEAAANQQRIEAEERAIDQRFKREEQLMLQAVEASDIYEGIADSIGEAATNALKLAGINITSGIDSAAAAAGRLAIRLGASVDAALALINIESGMKQQSGPRRESGRTLPQVTRNVPGSLGEAYRRSLKIGEFATGTSGGGGGGGAGKAQEDYLLKLQEEAELKLRMIGLSEEEQRRQEIIHELTKRELPIEEERIQKLLDTEEALRRATDAEQRREDLMNTIESNIENAMMALVDGSKSVEDAFRDMLRNILMEIYKQAVVQPIASGIGDFIGGIFGSANGNAFRSGNIIPFANGGVVSGPTLFPMRGAQTGLMGEAGPEAIMPLKRGKGGKLGVVADGASQPIVINQSFNFSANGDESVKRIIAQEAPKIANLTQKQIIEQRQRGGTMKSVFS